MSVLPLELTPKNSPLFQAFNEFKFNGSSIQNLLLRARSAFERLKEQISPEDDEAMVSEMFRLDPEGKPNASSTPYNEFNHSLSRKFPGRQDEASSFGSLDHSANDLFHHPGDKHMASTHQHQALQPKGYLMSAAKRQKGELHGHGQQQQNPQRVEFGQKTGSSQNYALNQPQQNPLAKREIKWYENEGDYKSHPFPSYYPPNRQNNNQRDLPPLPSSSDHQNYYEGDYCLEAIEGNQVPRRQCPNQEADRFSGLNRHRHLENHPTSHLFNLPELHIDPFTGDPADWPLFYDSFCFAIDSRPDLTNMIKLTYLINLLKRDSPAHRAVSGYAIRGENYPLIIRVLEERFGRERPYVNRLIDEILNHRTIPDDIRSLRAFIDLVEANCRQLKQMRSLDSEPMLLRAIQVKLPQKFLNRLLEMEYNQGPWSLTEFRKQMLNALRRREEVEQVSGRVNSSLPVKKVQFE
jgi:hypothetical protein